MALNSTIKKYLGPKDFYKRAMVISIPIALQQLLNSAMGVVDSIMVAQIGQVTAVGTAAQIENLMYNICFGATIGAGIYVAQFYGAKDYKNVKRSFGIGLLMCFVVAVFWTIAGLLFGKEIASFFIRDPEVISSALQYLHIAVWSYIPGALSLMFSFGYRGIHKTTVPMIIGFIAMFFSVGSSYLFIFGNFGFPKLGVQGAAIGTVLAQWLSLVLHVSYATLSKQVFFGKMKELFVIPKSLFRTMMRKTIPFVVNEFFFAIGGTLYIRAFGQLGTQTMDSYYVGNQISNVFLVIVSGISNACSAILGVALGNGDMEKAKEEGNYFIGMATVLAFVSSIGMIVSARTLVSLFGLNDPFVIETAVALLRAFSVRFALRIFNSIIFSSLRAGGDSKFLTLLDSGVMWAVGIPLSFLLVNVFHMTDIAQVFLIIQIEQLVRFLIGIRRYVNGYWIQNLTITEKGE